MTSVRLPPVREGLLEGRLKRLCFLRAIVAGAGLAAFLFSGFRTPGFNPLTLPQFHLLLGAGLVNFVYLGLLRTTLDRRALIMAQLVIDVLTISGLVFVAGPLTPHAYFYFAVVFLAAILIGPGASMGFAAFSGVLYGSLAFIYYWISVAVSEPTLAKSPALLKLRDLMSSEDLERFNEPGRIPQAVLFVGALHVVAWLAGKLAEEISRVRILNDEILVNMSGGVIAVDRTGGVVFANPQATELLGIREPPSRLVGRPYGDAFPPEIAAVIRRGLQERGRLQQELRVGERPLEISISQLADGRGGGIRGAVAIINDLTLRQQMERVTERAERFRALLEMSAGIAHEIRNPLASIRGAAQELDASALPGEDDRRLMQVVLRESDRLDKIVSEFLEYASDRPVDLALVNVPELLGEVQTLLRAREEGKAAVLQLESPPTLVAKGAPDQLKQVFLNLGLNALEACGPGGKIQIRCAPATSPIDPRPGIRIEFEDNGPGIPKEDMNRLFSPFFTTKPRGTGMGLAIARKIVTAHGGTISLDSEPGKGTIARVWIPAS
ncbi:MAG TPA: ATP-binding protein [Planctomycetota bacterium]|jgi:PAS domain S-box-containing protein